MRGTGQAVGPCSHLSTPINSKIHKADNTQKLESSLLQHCISIWFWEVSFPFSSVAPLLYVPRPARPQESCQDRGDSLRKIVGLICLQSEKHLRPTALSLNHSSEQLTAVSSVRRAIQKPVTGFFFLRGKFCIIHWEKQHFEHLQTPFSRFGIDFCFMDWFQSEPITALDCSKHAVVSEGMN